MKYRYLVLISFFWACEAEKVELPFDCSASGLNMTTATTGASCNTENGTITISATGGATPYNFSIGTESNSTGTFNNLAAGTYAAKVTDTNNCSLTESVSVTNADGVNITAVDVADAGCGSSNGSISVSAQGGSEPYTFELTNAGSSTDGVFSQLSNGSYELSVTDENGCKTTQTVDVLSGISLDADIAPLIQSNCATSNCHGGSQSPNLSGASNIIGSASRILARTSAGTMPPSGSLPQSDIDEIACWVNDGTPNN